MKKVLVIAPVITEVRNDVDELLLAKLPEALNEKQKLTKIGHILSKLKKQGKIELGEKKQWIRCKETSRK